MEELSWMEVLRTVMKGNAKVNVKVNVKVRAVKKPGTCNRYRAFERHWAPALRVS